MKQIQEKNENFSSNPQKNIIYGNPTSNKYGKFRCFCCPISSKFNVHDVLSYLKSNKAFQEYDKYVTAYRVNQQTAPFLTENQNELSSDEYVEGFIDDPTLEGSGEKLLHLLQKFNIENVLLMIGIEQYYPLNNFETSYFKIMIEKSKELLNSLYSKVLQYELPTENNLKESIQNFPAAGKSGIMIDILPNQTKIKNYRPNYFGSVMEKPLVNLSIKSKHISENEREKKKIETRMSNIIYNMEKIKASFDEPDFIQLKFLAQYENDPLIVKVFNLLMILEDYQKREDFFLKYDFEKEIMELSIEKLTKKKLKKISDMIRQEKRLNYDTLLLLNPTIAGLFQFILLMIKCYENLQSLKKIQNKIEEEKKNLAEPLQEAIPKEKSQIVCSVPLIDSEKMILKSTKKKEFLPRLHDRFDSSVKNFRIMLLKNRKAALNV